MWQAQHVADLLRTVDPAIRCELIPSDTFADLDLSKPISDLGGKGAFSKEIQQIVQAGHADVAVHSAKDLQAFTPEDLTIAAYPERGDPRDALVGMTLADLQAACASGDGTAFTVASGSNRRRALLLDLCPEIDFIELRGNIATRLSKLDDGSGSGPAALIMAAVALERLGLTPAVVNALDPEAFTPQVGQGALAIEVSRDRADIVEAVRKINHADTELVVTAERSFLAELGGDCSLPAGAHATITRDPSGSASISIAGMLAADDYGNLQRGAETGAVQDEPGRELARKLRKRLEAAIS